MKELTSAQGFKQQSPRVYLSNTLSQGQDGMAGRKPHRVELPGEPSYPKMPGEPPRVQPSKKVAAHWDQDGNRVEE